MRVTQRTILEMKDRERLAHLVVPMGICRLVRTTELKLTEVTEVRTGYPVENAKY
jgi:hypothetical protein